MGDVKFVNIPLSIEEKAEADELKKEMGEAWPQIFMKLIREEMSRRRNFNG